MFVKGRYVVVYVVEDDGKCIKGELIVRMLAVTWLQPRRMLRLIAIFKHLIANDRFLFADACVPFASGAKEMRLFALWRGELPKLAAMANTPSFSTLYISIPLEVWSLIILESTQCAFNRFLSDANDADMNLNTSSECSFYETRTLAYYLLIAVSINLCAIKMVVIQVVGCDEYARVRQKIARVKGLHIRGVVYCNAYLGGAATWLQPRRVLGTIFLLANLSLLLVKKVFTIWKEIGGIHMEVEKIWKRIHSRNSGSLATTSLVLKQVSQRASDFTG
nr:hypothetical protein [Tanacetum cinerariifolium]